MEKVGDGFSVAFQSTPSAWRETAIPQKRNRITFTFQSTPSAWRETHYRIRKCHEYHISIHSLRMEGDAVYVFTISPFLYFNPLPPHGGRLMEKLRASEHGHFNPLPPHGGRHFGESGICQACNFNPLPPHGGRLPAIAPLPIAPRISIHSLRMEGDVEELKELLEDLHFNPLPPHGGRHNIYNGVQDTSAFQSTPSAWRET